MKLEKEDLQPLVEMKKRIDKFSELFETFASLSQEDVSKMNLSPDFPKELNVAFVKAASDFKTAMEPVERLHDTIRQSLQAEQDDASRRGGQQ